MCPSNVRIRFHVSVERQDQVSRREIAVHHAEVVAFEIGELVRRVDPAADLGRDPERDHRRQRGLPFDQQLVERDPGDVLHR
jgi:hypothetical protein